MTRSVAEVMQREVVTVSPDTAVGDLLRLLVAEQISGVPVVTEDGEIVGVVSSTDVVRLAAGEAEVPGGDLTWEPMALPPEEEDDESPFLPFFLSGEDRWYPTEGQARTMPEGLIAGFTVSDIMTPAAFNVRSSDTVETVAKFLLKGRIHRALVVDGGQLQGIVTTFDLLRALVPTDEG